MSRFFKISDFAKEIGRHANTVDNWFKMLEEKQMHYVNRVDGEKVYDEMDLSIALHIRDKRDDKWALEAIGAQLGAHFDLRPFPPEMEPTTALQIPDMELLRKKFGEEIRAVVEELAATQVAELRQQHTELLRQLPKPKDPIAERLERVTEMTTRRRVERALEREALHMWSTKPEAERLKRAGLLRKEEDRDKREQFVKDHIDQHFESRLLEQFGLNDEKAT
jgi:hypothetical protein